MRLADYQARHVKKHQATINALYNFEEFTSLTLQTAEKPLRQYFPEDHHGGVLQ